MPQLNHIKLWGLPMLMVSYALASWLPGPGIWLRQFKLSAWQICPPVQVQHLMLAIMLFSAGLATSSSALIGSLRQFKVVLQLTSLAYVLPALAGIIAAILLGFFPSVPVEVRLAILMIAAMPIANSSAGWAAHLGANLGLSLLSLMAATMLSPLVTGPIINLGIYASGLKHDGVHTLPAWGNDMSTFFAMWVLAPIFVGLVVAACLPENWLTKTKQSASRTSMAMLLLLNYVNGTVCLPELWKQPSGFMQPLMASILLVVLILLFLACWQLFRTNLHSKYHDWSDQQASSSANPSIELAVSSSSPDQSHTAEKAIASTNSVKADRLSLVLALVMRNTGAAMVYTTTALESVPIVSLVVVVYTLIQHVLIALFAYSQMDSRR